jgi:hypothetical protein
MSSSSQLDRAAVCGRSHTSSHTRMAANRPNRNHPPHASTAGHTHTHTDGMQAIACQASLCCIGHRSHILSPNMSSSTSSCSAQSGSDLNHAAEGLQRKGRQGSLSRFSAPLAECRCATKVACATSCTTKAGWAPPGIWQVQCELSSRSSHSLSSLGHLRRTTPWAILQRCMTSP